MSADDSSTREDAATEPELTEPEAIEPAPPATESLEAEGGIDVAEQSLARPAAVMAVGTALSRLTGLGRIAAMAYALGVTESRVADSYNLANTLPNVIYELVLGGVLSSVFIPVLVQELRTKDNREAWRSVSSLVTAAMMVLIGLTLVTMLIAPQIIDVFTSRVGGSQGAEQQQLASFLLRVFALQITLYGFAGIAGGLLNSHGRFAVPMFAPIVNNLFVIGSFIVFAQIVSGTPQLESGQRRRGRRSGCWRSAPPAAWRRWHWYSCPSSGSCRAGSGCAWTCATRRCASWRGWPSWTVAYVVTNVLGFVVSFYLANQQQGGITAYVTAFAFFQVPIGLAAVPIATALMPKLSAHHVDRSDSEFRVALARGIRVTSLLMLPATALYLVLADPLIELLLQHGIVGGDSAHLVASTLQFFSIGLLPFALYQLFTRAFYARQNARLPAYINVVENGVSIALDFALFPLMDVRGLALAHTLGYVAGSALAAVVLRRELGPFGARHIVVEFGKAAIAAARDGRFDLAGDRGSRRSDGQRRRARLRAAGARRHRRRRRLRGVRQAAAGRGHGGLQPPDPGAAAPAMSASLLATVYPPLAPAGLLRPRPRDVFPFDRDGLTYTHLGRGAVWLALRALGLGAGKRIAMPAYHCGSEVEAARLAGLAIDFYRVDPELRVDRDDLERVAAGCDAVYLISNFGFPMTAPVAGVVDDRGCRARAVLGRGRRAARVARRRGGLLPAQIAGRGRRRRRAGAFRRSADGYAGPARRSRDAALVRLADACARRDRAGSGRAAGRGRRPDPRQPRRRRRARGLADRDRDRRVGSRGRRHGGGGPGAGAADGICLPPSRRRADPRAPPAQLRAAGRRACRAGAGADARAARRRCAALLPAARRRPRRDDRAAALAAACGRSRSGRCRTRCSIRNRFRELEPARHELLALPVHQSLGDWQMQQVLAAAKAALGG